MASETPETAEVETTKSAKSTEVEATKVASSEVATTEVTTTEVTTAETAGIRDIWERNEPRNERCGNDRHKFTHDTLLLDGDLLLATEVLRKWRSCGFFSRIYRSDHQHRVRGTMVSPVSRCSITCQSLHSRTMRRWGSISMRSGGRCTCGGDVSCAAVKVDNPTVASANTANSVIDRRMRLPRFGWHSSVSHRGAGVNGAL